MQTDEALLQEIRERERIPAGLDPDVVIDEFHNRIIGEPPTLVRVFPYGFFTLFTQRPMKFMTSGGNPQHTPAVFTFWLAKSRLWRVDLRPGTSGLFEPETLYSEGRISMIIVGSRSQLLKRLGETAELNAAERLKLDGLRVGEHHFDGSACEGLISSERNLTGYLRWVQSNSGVHVRSGDVAEIAHRLGK